MPPFALLLHPPSLQHVDDLSLPTEKALKVLFTTITFFELEAILAAPPQFKRATATTGTNPHLLIGIH